MLLRGGLACHDIVDERERGMIVFHVAVTTSDDYISRREPHRRDHLGRLQGLRASGICIGGGPAVDGRSDTPV